MEIFVAAAATCTAGIVQPVSHRHGPLFWINKTE
jgi:hypothetical protein